MLFSARLTLTTLLIGVTLTVQAPNTTAQVVVDPQVHRMTANGRVRVLVELRLRDGDSTTPEAAIAEAQDEVLRRLPPSHVSLARRYSSIPLLALETDDVGLRVLDGMPDLVAAVKLDETARPQ